VLEAAARHLTPVLLELGGKSANIVFPDSDLAAAATMGCTTGIVNGAGQACSLPTRLLVHESVYDEVAERVVAIASAITLGRPFDEGIQMGPVISAGACARILGIVDQAVADGTGELLTGGRRAGGNLADGYFIEPTVFGRVDPTSSLAQNEVFGPVLSIIGFRDEDEAVAIANSTRYGLAAYVWTADLKRAHRVAGALEAGWIGINGFPPMPPNAPFGGYKASGFGREGGAEGVREFVRTKNVYVHMD
jgi:aldehyde dehydrogenase (NAD+)